MEKKVNIPKKGAGRRLAQKLRNLGRQSPPEDFMKKINKEDDKKVAVPATIPNDLDI